MKPKESAGCHQTLSVQVGSGDETNTPQKPMVQLTCTPSSMIFPILTSLMGRMEQGMGFFLPFRNVTRFSRQKAERGPGTEARSNSSCQVQGARSCLRWGGMLPGFLPLCDRKLREGLGSLVHVCQQYIVRRWGQGLDQRTKKDQKIKALLSLCWQSWTSLSSDYSGRNSSASANTLSDPSFEAYGKSSSHFQMVLSVINSLHKLGIKYLEWTHHIQDFLRGDHFPDFFCGALGQG